MTKARSAAIVAVCTAAGRVLVPMIGYYVSRHEYTELQKQQDELAGEWLGFIAGSCISRKINYLTGNNNANLSFQEDLAAGIAGKLGSKMYR